MECYSNQLGYPCFGGWKFLMKNFLVSSQMKSIIEKGRPGVLKIVRYHYTLDSEYLVAFLRMLC
jgi:hypothetical protein